MLRNNSHSQGVMARTKQRGRKSTGGRAPKNISSDSASTKGKDKAVRVEKKKQKKQVSKEALETSSK